MGKLFYGIATTCLILLLFSLTCKQPDNQTHITTHKLLSHHIISVTTNTNSVGSSLHYANVITQSVVLENIADIQPQTQAVTSSVSQELVINYIYSRFPVNNALASCIAKHESGYNLFATHLNNNGTTDYGLFQINSSNFAGLDRAGIDISANPFDMTTNTDAALYLSRNGVKWGDWTTLHDCI